MLPARELGVALTRINSVTVRGPFFRTVAFKYLRAVGPGASNILSGVPGRDRGGRYNPAGGFATTYLAESVETAVSELERVLDLLDPRVRARVGTDEAELVAPYLLDAPKGETATQRLGRIAYESARFEGLRGPSVQRAGGQTIAVFPACVAPPSKLEVFDPDGLLRDRLPL